MVWEFLLVNCNFCSLHLVFNKLYIMKYKFKTKSKDKALALALNDELLYTVHEINYNLRRNYLKYQELTDQEYDIAEKIFNDINSIIEDNKLTDLINRQ